jgi:hypothetical protein
MTTPRLRHRFVEFIPDDLEEGVLYISLEYRTASHRCCCGCGHEVVTPLSPTDWQLTFDGETVSLSPSIGNWSFPCQSHYWVRAGRVSWARQWSRQEIDAGREADRMAKRTWSDGSTKAAEMTDGAATAESSPRRPRLFARMWNWLAGLSSSAP